MRRPMAARLATRPPAFTARARQGASQQGELLLRGRRRRVGFPREVRGRRARSVCIPRTAVAVLAPAAQGTRVRLDEERGLDHGAWSVLRRMYPRADVPTCQLSLDHRLSPAERYQLAAQLRPLRDRGVLVAGAEVYRREVEYEGQAIVVGGFGPFVREDLRNAGRDGHAPGSGL